MEKRRPIAVVHAGLRQPESVRIVEDIVVVDYSEVGPVIYLDSEEIIVEIVLIRKERFRPIAHVNPGCGIIENHVVSDCSECSSLGPYAIQRMEGDAVIRNYGIA